MKEKLILTSSLRDVLANDTLWGIMGNEKIGKNKKKKKAYLSKSNPPA